MKAKHFVRYVGQFGLPCIEQQHQRCMKSFALFWSCLAFALCCATLYQLENSGSYLWVVLGIDSFAALAFMVSAWQRYQLHCYISSYRQKHPQASPLRSFSNF